MHTSNDAEVRVRRWIDEIVVGLNLCPFAGRVLRAGKLRIVCSTGASMAGHLARLGDELARLATDDARAEDRADDGTTTIVVYPDALQQFDDYLDFVAMAQALLEDAGLDGEIQLASFHPQYVFGDAPAGDPANYTNRSPYPLLHLLRESAVEEAISEHPDTTAIPQRNIALLRGMSEEDLAKLAAHSE